MIAPDEIPAWFALAAAVALCVVWRRQVVVARREAKGQCDAR